MKIKMIFKRLGAYLIDYMLIALVSSAVTRFSIICPDYDKYVEASNNYTEVLESYYKEEINIEEYNEKVTDLGYEVNKYGSVFIGCNILITLLYFGGFAYWTKGETLGKKIMKLRIVNSTDGEVKLWQYLVRSVILNGVLMNLCILVAVFFSKEVYLDIYRISSSLNSVLSLLIIFMMLFTKEGRGLHDYIAKTKVIATNCEV